MTTIMLGKPACYYDSSSLSEMKMEETIRKWLEDKLEDLELVERDLKKHVRTFVGIFRLSRQDLVQDIKEEPQYPLEVRRDMDGQYSLEDLRKSVFVFEFMKLTCLKKEEADRIVDELFTEWNLIAVEKLKEEKEDLAQKRPVSQPACPVSRSEQETSYTTAFPALPPKGNKPKMPSESIPSFWEQRSPLRSNPSVQSSKSKIGLQDSSSEKASALSNKKIRTGGKENECAPACTEPKKKMNKNRDVRSRRESSSSSVQSPRSREEQQRLEEMGRALKSYLGVSWEKAKASAVTIQKISWEKAKWEKAKASAESFLKKVRESQTLETSASTSEGKEQLYLNPTQNSEESVWDRNYVTKYPLWFSQNGAEETASCKTQNQRSASEPYLAKQEQRIDCGLPKERTWTHSESTSSSPAPAQGAEPSMVDSLFKKEILRNVNSPGFTGGSFDLQVAEPSMVQFNSIHFNLVDHPNSPCFTGGSFDFNPIDHTSTTGIHSDGLFLSDPIWNRSHISEEKWPTQHDNRIPQGMNLHPATSVCQMQEKPENMASGYPCPSYFGHFDNFIEHNMKQNLGHWFNMFQHPDRVCQFHGSEAKRDRWWHHQVDSSYASDEEEATVSPDSDSWKRHLLEHSCFSFEDKSSTVQEQLQLATTSDFLNARQQSPAHAMGKNSQDTFQNAMSPSVIERAVDQIFPQHLSKCLNRDEEFQGDSPFRNHGYLHNHLPSMDSVSFPTSCMLTTMQDCSSSGCISDHNKQQISSRLLRFCSCSHQSHNAQMPFPSHPHSFSFREDATHANHPQSEPNPKSFMLMQPSQSAGSGEDTGYKLFHGRSFFSVLLHHPVMADHPRKSEDDIDQFGIRNLASMLEKNCQKNWEECLKEQQSTLMENDLSGSPDLMEHSSFIGSSQQDFCSCEGACNCLSVLPVEFSLGGREEVASDAIHPYKQQRVGQSCLQTSQNVMKSASDSKLSFHESAFRSINGASYPILALPSLPQIAYPFDTPSEKKTTPTCSIQDASEYQLEKIKKNSLRVVKPEVMKPEEPEEVAVPDLSILHHPDVYGNRQEKVQAMPSYPFLNFKESKETQTSHVDIESDVLPSLSSRPFPKPVYEEKHWKDLLPVSAEDEHRDWLFAACNAEIQGKGVESLDVAALEGYDFADFQLLTETSTSLHVPQNQAVYVKDLEKAWLSESYRRLGKNKVRKPLHPNKPCSFFLEGCCYRFDCKFSHDIDTITCQFWEAGQCFKGVLCPFLHGYFGGSSASEVGEVCEIIKEDYPERSRKDVRLNSAPASKKRKNKKNSIHRLQLPRGT